jgi:hypothetical protein
LRNVRSFFQAENQLLRHDRFLLFSSIEKRNIRCAANSVMLDERILNLSSYNRRQWCRWRIASYYRLILSHFVERSVVQTVLRQSLQMFVADEICQDFLLLRKVLSVFKNLSLQGSFGGTCVSSYPLAAANIVKSRFGKVFK